MLDLDRRARQRSFLSCCGALLAALSIALSAYASHGIADELVQSRLNTAAFYAFGHGAVLAVLGRSGLPAPGRLSLCLMLIGTLFFSGSLIAGALLAWSTRLAPAGGMALMVGWLLFAVAALRR